MIRTTVIPLIFYYFKYNEKTTTEKYGVLKNKTRQIIEKDGPDWDKMKHYPESVREYFGKIFTKGVKEVIGWYGEYSIDGTIIKFIKQYKPVRITCITKEEYNHSILIIWDDQI